jgi:pyridoxamine 5'-phosphate oxidase
MSTGWYGKSIKINFFTTHQMITFKNLSKQDPYILFKKKYDEAILSKQKFIEAACVSSFSKEKDEVDSRYVNLKFIDNKEFIFFSNYQSPKSSQFSLHDQISVVIFWSEINFQIRLKAKIKKTSLDYSRNYFKTRSKGKNALAISSSQSRKINSYDSVKDNYNEALSSKNLTICPDYWGGFAFTPYYFEFWEGQDLRLNKRDVYEQNGNNWNHFMLQP